MLKFNAENERIKWKYLEWEKEARGKADSKVNNIRNALYLFETDTDFKNFKMVKRQDFIAFKKQLCKKKNLKTGNLVSKTYSLHTSKYLISFFQWLYSQKGYKRKFNITDICYLNLSAKDTQIARSTPSKRHPTIQQIEHVVRNMPSETEIQKRDRALIALIALTGARVTAVASLKLKHVFDDRIEQHPQEVKTKYSKKIITYFFPTGEFLEGIFREWVHFLKNEKLFDNKSPLFPSTKLSLDENEQFSRNELDTVAWQSTTSIRTIIKNAFEGAGLDYYNPHSFRKTIVQVGYEYCKTPEDFKAWSQNLGHNSPLTTFTSYGTIDEFSQGGIIKRLISNKKKNSETSIENELASIKKLLEQQARIT